MAIPIEGVKEEEKLIEERGQILAAAWTYITGLGSDLGYSPCRRYLCIPEGRA